MQLIYYDHYILCIIITYFNSYLIICLYRARNTIFGNIKKYKKHVKYLSKSIIHSTNELLLINFQTHIIGFSTVLYAYTHIYTCKLLLLNAYWCC